MKYAVFFHHCIGYMSTETKTCSRIWLAIDYQATFVSRQNSVVQAVTLST